MNKPKGIIFDLGDTVLRSLEVDWVTVNARLIGLAENDRGITAEELQKHSEQLFIELDKARNESMLEHPTAAHYRLLFESLGISLSISYEEAADICWEHAHAHSPEDGICDVLDLLSDNGIRTGILSNCTFSGEKLEKDLKKYGLSGRFPFIISSMDYGLRKPHPYIFKVAAQKIGLEPDDIWFAGNKPEIDIKGAVNAGFFPVWYNRPNEPSTHGYKCLEIHTWYEFIDILKSFG